MTTGQQGRPTAKKAPILGQPLTPREAAVTALVAEGHSNRVIAARLGITEQTVKNHLTAIFDKIGVATRVQLAIYQTRGGETAIS